MSSSRARRLWVKSVKLAMLTRDQCTNLHNVKDLRKLAHFFNCFSTFLWNLKLKTGASAPREYWQRTHFRRQLRRLACESSQAPTTLSELLEVLIDFQLPVTSSGRTLVH